MFGFRFDNGIPKSGTAGTQWKREAWTMIGQTISHYKILEKLGEGGMGIVYKAQDTRLDRIVALKFLPVHLTSNEAEKARFLQEAKAAATLNHPHVCTIYGISEHDDHEGGIQQFIEMEYVDGETLRKKIPLAKTDDAYKYAIQIGDALQEAHSKGIVHRDVKCENIMVNSKNQIKVMDFGLAKLKGSLKLTRTSSTVGTLAYMAPEQIQGGDVDARSDIFSFGIVLFEMLTGKTPFRGEHDAAMMYSIVNEEPETVAKYKPDVSPEVERIIKRALEKDPDDRYQSAADMVSEIRRVQRQSTRILRPSMVDMPTLHPTFSHENPVAKSTPSSKKKTILISALIGAALIIALAVYLLMGHQQAIGSLAVLPFENVGASPDQEYLSDGITENIINNLTKISSLRVVPRSTVFRFKGKELDVQDIGSKLNVNAVLTGRITHRGQSLDVQVDLIDIKRESQLWGNNYQSSEAEILSLQEQITKDVSSKLGLGLSTDLREGLAKRSTDNTQAYQLYLQGRYWWNKRTSESIDRAINFFNQAIALDSTYALAYAGLADCYIIQSQYSGIPTRITIPLTKNAARKALELDNSLAEAHTTLAFCLYEAWKYDEAEKEFKQAIALNPKYPTAYHWYNIMLVRTGRADEAWKIIQQAHDLDPFSPVITLNVGAIFFLRGQFEEALTYLKKSIELDPSFAPGYAWIGLTYDRMNNVTEALPQLEKALELSGRSAECISYLGYFYGKRGMRDKAIELLKENEERYKAGTGAAYNIARIYAGLGDKDNVLKWLEQDVADQSTWTGELKTDYVWDSVKTDPRFIALLHKVGL
ncbi:MAG: protein kinase [Bacteroidota bacterium]